ADDRADRSTLRALAALVPELLQRARDRERLEVELELVRLRIRHVQLARAHLGARRVDDAGLADDELPGAGVRERELDAPLRVGPRGRVGVARAEPDDRSRRERTTAAREARAHVHGIGLGEAQLDLRRPLGREPDGRRSGVAL